MKSSVKSMLVVLAIVMSFVMVQAVCAIDCNVTVDGEFRDTDSVDGHTITVSGVTVYGIPWLERSIPTPNIGDYVKITAHQSPSIGNLVACDLEITNNELEFEISLRPRKP